MGMGRGSVIGVRRRRRRRAIEGVLLQHILTNKRLRSGIGVRIHCGIYDIENNCTIILCVVLCRKRVLDYYGIRLAGTAIRGRD